MTTSWFEATVTVDGLRSGDRVWLTPTEVKVFDLTFTDSAGVTRILYTDGSVKPSPETGVVRVLRDTCAHPNGYVSVDTFDSNPMVTQKCVDCGHEIRWPKPLPPEPVRVHVEPVKAWYEDDEVTL